MAESNLGVYREDITTANDGIAIVQAVTDLPGGRTLEVAAYRESLEAYAAAHAEAVLAAAVYAGTPIGRTDAGEYLPFAVGADGAFTTPAGATPVGVARSTVRLSDPRVGIVTSGTVNWAAVPFKVGKEAREALPRLEFIHVAKGE